MDDKTENKNSEEKETNRESRRSFFKGIGLTAGTLALAPGMLTSCATTASQSSSGRGRIMAKNGRPPAKVDSDEWFAPQELDFSRLMNLKRNTVSTKVGNIELQNIGVLDVNLNSSGASTGQSADLFAYNGTVPGPTFRVDGSQSLTIFFTNSLSGNNGYYAVSSGSRKVDDNMRIASDTEDWQIDHHLYGPHQQHVTNLHTHGLHVSPGVEYQSDLDTEFSIHSDNVLLRVIPFDDFDKRVVQGKGPALMDNEQVVEALYNFKLPRPDGTPHYSGTHWYHPHPHGATYDQVASGMAGFLLVEGPVDHYLAQLYSNNAYLELPLLIQRIFAPEPVESEGGNSKTAKGQKGKTSVVRPTVNGQELTEDGVQVPQKQVYANQVIRLRVLNGSVDGQGYIRFMIVKDNGNNQNGPSRIDPLDDLYSDPSRCNKNGTSNPPKNASASAKRWFTSEVTDSRVCLNNIAFDGINLFDASGNYTNMPVEWLTIGVANRADFLVAIPSDAKAGDSFSIWVQDMQESVDSNNTNNESNLKIAQFNVVSGGNLPVPATNGDGSLSIDWVYQGSTLKAESLLMPVTDAEITISDNSEQTSAYLPPNPTNLQGQSISLSSTNNAGKIRARRVIYSGFGHNSVNNSVWGETEDITLPDGTKVTGPAASNLFNAMVIDGKKYGADTPQSQGWDEAQQKMLLGSAEEWSIYNYSSTTYLKKDGTATDPSDYVYGVPSFMDPGGSGATSKTTGVHHPFHIHQNPFYVRSIQDYQGNELLILDDDGYPIPRWQDTVYIPHNGGRVIMRSRFWDYTGKYVNHCHLLQHEDWGMMQVVEVVDGTNGNLPNYLPLPASDTQKQNIFPPLSLQQIFTFNVGKVKDVLTESSLKMLCYDPSTTSFFDQINLTNLTVTATDMAGYLKVPVPTQTDPYPTWDNDIDDNG